MITKIIGQLLGTAITFFIYVSPFLIIILLIKKFEKNPRKHKPKNPQYNPEWTWVEDRRQWVHESELAKQIHVDRSKPSYESWKASQEAKSEPNLEEIKFTVIIPDDIKQRIEDKKREEAQKQTKPVSKYAYEATPLLTHNESRNYKALKQAADRKGYSINSKVRLADLVKPKNDENFWSNFGKIKSKHVDFVICDQNMQVKAIIELDDNSHDKPDRQQRDQFVDEILTAAGYRIIHTRHITPDILDGI